MAESRHSVLDVIELALGERGDRISWESLSTVEINELRDRLLEFSTADAETSAPEGTYLLTGGFARYWEDPAFRGQLSDALLYYPQLLVLDPFADFFADLSVLPRMRPMRYMKYGREAARVSSGAESWATGDTAERFAEDPAGLAARLGTIARNLYELEIPIRSGTIVLRNQWEALRPRRHALEASLRADIRSPALQAVVRQLHENNKQLPAWDNLRGAHMTTDGTLHPSDAPWEFQHFLFYLAKTLAVADSAKAIYAPARQEDLQLLEAKVESTPDRGYPPQVLAQVSKILLPASEVAIREAAHIRESSSDFADWRAALRTFARDATADTPDQLRERAEDEFLPRVHQIEREMSGNKGRATREAALELLTVGTISTATTALTSDNMALGVGVGAAAAVATGMVGWLRNAYRRPKLHGADAVLACLIRSDIR